MTRGDKFAQFVKLYERSFGNHVLSTAPQGYWRMKNPTSGFYSTNILFVAGRIIIFGDATVVGERGNGAISDVGYDLAWFVSDLDPDYLCSKFLDKRWDEDRVEEWAREERDDLERNEDAKCALYEILQDKAFTEFEFGEAWQEHAEDGEDWPSRDYDTAHAAMLHVVQKTFARLYDGKEAPHADR